MNKIKSHSLLLVLVFLLSACGEQTQSVEDVIAGGDLEQIRALRSEIKADEMELIDKLEALDAKIDELDTTEKLPLITVEQLVTESFKHYIELQGNVMTRDNLMLYPEFSGLLNSVYVKEGQRVSKGQVLARVDDGGLSQQRAQMALQADLAKTTYEKQKRLWDQQVGSEMQYLQAKTASEAQQKALGQMDRQLAKTSIRAPFSGVIDEVMAEPGSVVMPGQSPILRIISLRDMYVEVNVPESHLPKVKKNNSVKVEFPVLGEEVESQIRTVGSYINPANRTFKIEVAVPNKDEMIKPNLTAKVKINDYSNDKALLIPQNVMSEDAHGMEYVYIIKDIQNGRGKAERAYIQSGLTRGDKIEILSGLEAGMSLVIEGARAIRDGIMVEILGTANAASQQLETEDSTL